MDSGSIDKQKLERVAVNQHAKETLSPSAYSLWSSLGSSHRLYVYKNRRYAVWSATGGVPTVHCTLIVEKLHADFDSGTSIQVYANHTTLQVTHNPVQLGTLPIFLWMPSMLEIRWLPRDYLRPGYKPMVTAPICVKTMSNQTKGILDGHVYISPLKQFAAEWPNVAVNFN